MPDWNRRLGVVLFCVYLVLYGGFVALNAFSPQTMEQTPWRGVNLAIWSGFGLIFAAFGLAVIYGLFCDDAAHGRPTQQADTSDDASHPNRATGERA